MTSETIEHRSHPLLVCVGCLNVDLLARVTSPPLRDDRITSTGFERRPGGMAANVACAAARLGPPLAVQTQLVAPLGADADSAWLETELAARGVDTRWLDRSTRERATICVVLVEPDGARSIISEPSRLSYACVDRCLQCEARGPRPRLVHVDGVHAPGARDVVSAAARNGWRTSVDVDELPGEHLDEERLPEFTAPFDTVFINRAQARAALGERAVDDWIAALARWAAATGTTYLLTLGEEGAVVAAPDAAPARLRPPTVHSVDTTGAGDAFAGVYLACRLNGMSPFESARRACVAGAIATTGHGALGAIPDAAAIEALMGRV